MDLTITQFPGEEILTKCLQKVVHFYIQNRCIRAGKLLLYKPSSFTWCLTLGSISPGSSVHDTNNFEMPMPLKVEDYPEEGLFYFDYRLINAPSIYHAAPSCKIYEYKPLGDRRSIFFDTILECRVDTLNN